MASDAPYRNAVNLVLDTLAGLGLGPVPIPHGRIDELRGGIQCFDLKEGEGVDAAVLLSKLDVEAFPLGESKILYKVDYAVRGNVKGVLPRRTLSRTVLELKGLLKRRLVGLRWEVPSEERGGSYGHRGIDAGGLPPFPGELWEGGPHQTLTERLNGDSEQLEALKNFTAGDSGAPPILTVFSDGWGESMRIRGYPWVKAGDLPTVYTSPAYLKIVNKIGRHVKEVRRSFGGLTF